MFGIQPKVAERTKEIHCERSVRGKIGRSGLAVRPEAIVQNLRHNAAVRVVPACDSCVVSGADGVLKDGLVLAEWRPLAGRWVFEREEHSAGRDVDGVRRDTREEGRHDVTRVDTCRHHMREKGRLSCEPIECGKLETGETTLVELLVGKLVEQNPQDARVRFRICSGLLFVKSWCGVQVTSLPAAPDKLGENNETSERKESENGSSSALDGFKSRQKSLPERSE